MNLRLTTGQTSGEKIWKNFLLAQKNRRQISGALWGSFECLTSSSGRKARKTPSRLFKDKKGTQLLRPRYDTKYPG